MPDEKLSKTPLHRCHLQLGARMVPFAGYEMPVQYSSVLDEAKRVRQACGLFDVSHMGQFSIRGKNSLAEVQKLVTNDLRKLEIGQAQYNMLCNPEGGVIDDLVIYRRSEEETFICVNASNRKADYEWITTHLGSGVILMTRATRPRSSRFKGRRPKRYFRAARMRHSFQDQILLGRRDSGLRPSLLCLSHRLHGRRWLRALSQERKRNRCLGKTSRDGSQG